MNSVQKVLISVALGLTMLAGCATTPDAPEVPGPIPADAPGVVFVLGVHANAPARDIDNDFVPLIEHIADVQGRVAVVVNDGNPFVSFDEQVGAPCQSSGCDAARADALDQVGEALNQAAAKSPESDLLAALDLAARTSVKDGIIAICDSGLSTAGAMNFQQDGMLSADPAEVVDFLTKSRALPALSGQRILLGCLGEVVAPQQDLSSNQQVALQEMWQQVLIAAGAGEVILLTRPLAESHAREPLPGLPTVATVPIPAPTTLDLAPEPTEAPEPAPESAPESAPQPAPVTAAPTPADLPAQNLSEDQLPFVPEEAALLYPDAARELLKPLAQYVIDNDMYVRITGTTSSYGSPEGRIQTSEDRAKTVQGLLIEFGVPADRIQTRGLGNEFEGAVVDRDANGNLLPGPAAQNRKVIVEVTAAKL